MERISVTTATRNFSEILNQVILKGAIFELETIKLLQDYPQPSLHFISHSSEGPQSLFR